MNVVPSARWPMVSTLSTGSPRKARRRHGATSSSRPAGNTELSAGRSSRSRCRAKRSDAPPFHVHDVPLGSPRRSRPGRFDIADSNAVLPRSVTFADVGRDANRADPGTSVVEHRSVGQAHGFGTPSGLHQVSPVHDSPSRNSGTDVVADVLPVLAGWKQRCDGWPMASSAGPSVRRVGGSVPVGHNHVGVGRDTA